MGQRANGEGTVYRRSDGRCEAAGYVTTTDGGSKRVGAPSTLPQI
jgi:hypothetical protein